MHKLSHFKNRLFFGDNKTVQGIYFYSVPKR